MSVTQKDEWHPNRKDITGQKYGMLTALHSSTEKIGGQYKWMFRCECGNVVGTLPNNARLNTTGCGDHKITKKRAEYYSRVRNKPTIRKDNPKTYNSWRGMKDRCQNENHFAYKYYGGRGIKVCKRWIGKNGFRNFLADMDTRPESMTLDRIDGNGDYEPSNCRWATILEQNRNNRRNKYVHRHGGKYLLQDMMDKYDIPISSLYKILRVRGLPHSDAVNYYLDNHNQMNYIIRQSRNS